MTTSVFQLPDELILAPIFESFPCRDPQIRSLATLLHPNAAPCRNLTIHGVPSTGKTAITTSLLTALSTILNDQLSYAIVPAAQCITSRHLFERILSLVSSALNLPPPKRCETLAQLTVELCKMLKYEDRGRFILVLDAVDRARDAPATLLPALARLSEIIPCLTTVFIVTSPQPDTLRTTSSPSLHFPPYTKQNYITILSLTPPTTPIPTTSLQETQDLWPRFCAAVHDALVKSAARSLPAFKRACLTLWPRFIAPVEKGTYTAKEFSKLLVAGRSHFQDESVLNPSLVSGGGKVGGDLAALLPKTARMLLLCAYLASHNAPRHDLTLFSTTHTRKRRRGSSFHHQKHRKIARKLLGAHAFVLERMLAILAAVRTEWTDGGLRGSGGLDGDVGMALGTLASLRLLNRVGTGGDLMDRGGKWRINVGWEVVRGVGRSIGVEVEEWLIE